MAKVKGPLLSLKAQGSLGKKITYRSHKKNTTVTRWSQPTGQASQAQLQNRVKMKQARAAWSELSDSEKLYYTHLGFIRDNIPGYNFFIRLCFAGKIDLPRRWYGTNTFGGGHYQ